MVNVCSARYSAPLNHEHRDRELPAIAPFFSDPREPSVFLEPRPPLIDGFATQVTLLHQGFDRGPRLPVGAFSSIVVHPNFEGRGRKQEYFRSIAEKFLERSLAWRFDAHRSTSPLKPASCNAFATTIKSASFKD